MINNYSRAIPKVKAYEGQRTITLPDLAEIQKESFQRFLTKGLAEELYNFSPVTDYTGRLELYFLHDHYTFEEHQEPNKAKTPMEARLNEQSYTKKLYIKVRFVNRDTGEIKESKMFIGEIPMMTERGTFIVNGAERVVVSQIVRSPGIYYKRDIEPSGKRVFNATLIPNRGAWVKLETDISDFVYIKIDKTRKIPVTIFLRALGYSTNEMKDLFSHFDYLSKTFDKDPTESEDEALIEIYKKMRPGEHPTVEGARQLLESRFFNPKKYDLGPVGRFKINEKLGPNAPDDLRVLTKEDFVAAIDYLIKLNFDEAQVDDIDHLGNRRVRSVGELLQNQFRLGLSRIERIIRERMTLQEQEGLTPANLINPKPLVSAIREFFGSSQLSQFMDQTNPLAELTHKRRISALGPGGLSRERAGFAVRDIHPSQHGRLCPIETPEGPNAGLISSLATHARVNEFGFIETPYRAATDGIVSPEVRYYSAHEEDNKRVATGDIHVRADGTFVDEFIPVKYKNEYIETTNNNVDLVGVSPIQIVSIGTSLIPFLEHDDANRALMGSNMQRQAVPLLKAERTLVGTGIEGQVARDSGMVVIADADGVISFASSTQITVKFDDANKGQKTYELLKYLRSNQDTCLNQIPIVKQGEKVKAGQALTDGAATCQGELALGKNLVVAFMPWEGYNFEDAILISERLVYDDVYTSIHIEKYEIDARQTKLGPEEITREIPNVGEEALKHLDENGIVRVGAMVEENDILVGKITPKGESDNPPEERLLRAIFGEKARDVKDNSLRVPHGELGRVIAVRVYDREKGDELPPVSNKVVRIFIAQKRRISVGDKVAGRHGNKGIISRILPVEDMPHLSDGTPVDMVLNPLGVPSRMNVGQIYECILGMAASILDQAYEVPSFDEMFGEGASNDLVTKELQKAKDSDPERYSWLNIDCKQQLYDGRTGEAFDNPALVGVMYVLKLVHLVDDKIHARSTGPYSLVTQQPLGGKAQFGGQRLGEMECWTLEAYGAAYTLQEMLTIKSDDVIGRSRAYEAIVKGDNIPPANVPESFKVLMKELQSIGLDIHALKKNDEEGTLEEVDLYTDSFDPLRSRNVRTRSLEDTIKELTDPSAARHEDKVALETKAGFSFNQV
ncbi:MAG: DNA-directed RNA polymerase subunit beta [Cyanobacteria bacterium]|nr:DNA-directed RNA polymerase subunit beta [Cyanobacteriota bacterium]MDA1021218.1 DNA-directed RNA polymerase subunit beta [Cyanobacteriota bacterium]